MKNIEDQMRSAQFRANLMNKYNYDPGPDWEQPDAFQYAVILVVGFLMLKTWLSS